MMRSAVCLLLVAYLPGLLAYRSPVLDRHRRASLAAEERVFWAVVISLVWSLAVALTLAAVGRYSFERLLAIDALVSAAILLAVRGRLLYRGTAPRVNAGALLPAALVALGIWLYFPPSEYVMGGKDPGTYMNEGIQIAQRGALIVRDPIVASVPPEYRDLFFPQHQVRYGELAYYGIRFMGFFVLDPSQGTVLGQFPHLYPVSIAVAYGVDGLTGARRASSVWALLGLVAVYLVGARLFGRVPAFAGTVLLAINVVQVWFAKYPNAEVVMQALLFAALLACARSLVDDDPWFAPLAGGMLALLVFLRYDVVLAFVAVGAAAAFSFRERRVSVLALAIPLGIGFILAWLYLTRLMAPYAAYPVGFTRGVGFLRLVLAGLVGFAALVVVSKRQSAARLLQAGLIVAVTALAVYAYFFREPVGRTALHDAMAMRTLGWYLTRGGLLMAVTGLVLAIRYRLWRDPATILTAIAFSTFFLYKIRIVPDHFWMARRFLPVIIPAALLFAAFLVFHATGAAARWLATRLGGRTNGLVRASAVAAAIVLLCPLGWQFARASEPVVDHVEYAGLIPRLEDLARRFADDELVIVESRNSSDTHVLALPLAYIYARNVLVLHSPRPDKSRFLAFLEWARTRYREIYFIGGGGTDLLSRSIAVSAVDSERYQVPEYASTRNTYPTEVRQKEFDYGIYRFVTPRAGEAWFNLDVGALDDLHVVRFHSRERTGDYTFRWTRRVSYVTLVGLNHDAQVLTLWLHDGGRPDSLPPAHIRVFIDDRFLGETDVGSGFRPYSFPIPSVIAEAAAARDEPARLQIESTTWNPRAALGVPDDRDVGVMVDRIEAR